MSQHISGSPSKVEVGLTQAGLAGDKGLNFITNSHLKGSEAGLSGLFYHTLAYGYTIRKITHSHPIDIKVGVNDTKVYTQIIDTQKGNGYLIPEFYIYHVPTKTYIKYRPK